MRHNLIKVVCVTIALFLASYAIYVQITTKPPEASIYRYSATKVNALVHTKLDLKFDYVRRYLYGKEWATFKPYAYTTDSLSLDARGMDIKAIAMLSGTNLKPLRYRYDQEQIKINLGKQFLPGQAYTIYIEYVAKPEKLKANGSASIEDSRGLYFINPDSAIRGKPIQIWTQGETQSSSAWFPTIDNPNQKTTSEIILTVPSKYVTLSNGELTSEVENSNGTRTDTWKMALPHSTYLFMMAVGNFKIYRDRWRNKEVNYYLEPAFAPYAKQIFGKTPEMMELYSKLLGVDYPWNKYSQIVVRDFVTGSMENTTATVHHQSVQRTPREMLDENYDWPESTTAHELFHQWFGDYVTAESWSNITLNESFADFSEILWAEHKYGKDAADDHNYGAMENYLGDKDSFTKNLVRFNYRDKEDVFDRVTYEKGGRILNMMRNYLGNAIFFRGLNIYLKNNALKNGEAHLLRLAMEEASGKDMNWFFNQWYFGSGHPIVKIDYSWNAASKTQKVTIKQKQAGTPFIVPMAIDLYTGRNKRRYQVTLKDAVQTFAFQVATKPELVNVDADKIVLWQKTDNKPDAAFNFQFFNAPLFLDRLEAVIFAAKHQNSLEALKVLSAALKDRYYVIRIESMKAFDLNNPTVAKLALPLIEKLAATDLNNIARARPIIILGARKNPAHLLLFNAALGSQSYAVQGAGLASIAKQKLEKAFVIAKSLEKDSKGQLTTSIMSVYDSIGTAKEVPFFAKGFRERDLQEQYEIIPKYLGLVGKLNDPSALRRAVDDAKQIGLVLKIQGSNPFILEQLIKLKNSPNGKHNAGYIDNAIEALK